MVLLVVVVVAGTAHASFHVDLVTVVIAAAFDVVVNVVVFIFIFECSRRFGLCCCHNFCRS